MTGPQARLARREDLPTLVGLFDLSLRREARRDPLLVRAEGSWDPVLEGLLERRDTLLLVLEVEGVVEGYLLAFVQVYSGPRPPRSRLARLLGRPAPPPLIRPLRIGWVEDVFLTRRGRRDDGAGLLARAAMAWGGERNLDRIAGLITRGNAPAAAFARNLGLKPTRDFFARDLKES